MKIVPAKLSNVPGSALSRASAASRQKQRSESPSCAFASNSYNASSNIDSSERYEFLLIKKIFTRATGHPLDF